MVYSYCFISWRKEAGLLISTVSPWKRAWKNLFHQSVREKPFNKFNLTLFLIERNAMKALKCFCSNVTNGTFERIVTFMNWCHVWTQVRFLSKSNVTNGTFEKIFTLMKHELMSGEVLIQVRFWANLLSKIAYYLLLKNKYTR